VGSFLSITTFGQTKTEKQKRTNSKNHLFLFSNRSEKMRREVFEASIR
jgi:hypothetical protein